MPNGYRADMGKTYLKSSGKWVTKSKEKAFDYDKIDKKSWALLISFFRFYPDFFYDLIRAPNAQYGLELPQRIMLRVQSRYAIVYITGARGITKTYVVILSKEHDGVFYPRETIRYYAPSQKQSAKLASRTFKEIAQNYPIMASWWNLRNDRQDMFYAVTPYGSEISMYTPRGDSFSSLIGEEIAQEGEDGFDFETFESDVQKGHRNERYVNGKLDRTRVQLKQSYISNASSRNNKAFTVYRAAALDAMLHGEKYEGFCMDISWKSALLCNLRSIAYYKKEKKTTSPESWAREMEVKYGGDSGEKPVLADEILAQSRKIQVAELKHCGDASVTYIVAHDVSYEEGQKNAKCADVVWKLTQFTDADKREKYRKQAVFIENYPPPVTEALQAQRIKDLWQRFCLDGGEPTYIVVDARAVGKTVVQELMKPSKDGSPPLCCYNHCAYTEIEQQNALPVIYPVKATGSGVDSDYEMIKYCQREWQQGNIEILTANAYEGVQAYKTYHGIKNDLADSKIAHPYKQTDGFCEEVKNLYLKPSGTGFKESRKKNSIQRDRWSAGKYGLHFASMLEDELVKQNYKAKSSWDKRIEAYKSGGFSPINSVGFDDVRSNLLAKRGR